jgi:hypothetical protein
MHIHMHVHVHMHIHMHVHVHIHMHMHNRYLEFDIRQFVDLNDSVKVGGVCVCVIILGTHAVFYVFMVCVCVC